MNHPRTLTIIAGLAAFAPTGLSAETVYPPAQNATVAVHDCGARPVLAKGSSPYNGSVIPDQDDPSIFSCMVEFATTAHNSPFKTIAPICTWQIQGPRTKWTVLLTAKQIKFVWDEVIFGKRVPPQWISWSCQYPWPPD